jgi:transcriptional regulator with XRE-family HTH domain
LSHLPPDLTAPPPRETEQERFARRLAVAALLRRRRLEAGLTFRQVAHATMTDASRISRYEQAWQYPSVAMCDRILEAITRLDADGAGNPTKAARAKAECAEADAEAVGSAR